jgi:uncharacterized protein YutE (UPF0331/DUF86 family)
MGEVFLQKRDIILRGLGRIEKEYGGSSALWEQILVQDAVMLNLLRACEASIDLAMHAVAKRQLGTPRDSREAFKLLETAGVLNASQTEALQRMVGFRNLAVHQYQEIDPARFRAVIDDHLQDFRDFINAIGRSLA